MTSKRTIRQRLRRPAQGGDGYAFQLGSTNSQHLLGPTKGGMEGKTGPVFTSNLDKPELEPVVYATSLDISELQGIYQEYFQHDRENEDLQRLKNTAPIDISLNDISTSDLGMEVKASIDPGQLAAWLGFAFKNRWLPLEQWSLLSISLNLAHF
ncbi:hypothetical protein M378DRAFT_16945 [Amanita muscaria Koide BX008]|uniref:Uncharacterized protein n=1 Tax=Amanita muscaria (strain Koide BX008) TaxID=946122 RepID=A0A0C2WKA9_AMAMK|nr:hypothetical protein M378DRAFT_16945 [Amanita muscaria Koide BX008]